MKHRTLTYLVWRDALAHEASTMEPTGPSLELAVLHELGWLLAETDDVVCIGMELQEGETQPGRWRLTVAKNAIVERHDTTVAAAFRKPRARKPKVVKPTEQTA